MPERPHAGDAGAHPPCRSVEDRAQLEIGHVVERPPRRDPRVPERLGLPHVPDPGDEPLVEQGVADRARARLAPEPLDHLPEVGRSVEDVRAEVREPAAVLHELQHRPVPEHRFDLVAAQHEPRPSRTAAALRLDPPPSGHPEVAPEHDAAFEAEEQVLPDRLHAFQRAAVQALGKPLRRRPRMRGLDLDPLACQHLQTVGSAAQGIAFGHTVSVVGHLTGEPMTTGLNIAALAQRTGVAPDTLRKWEQRYAILSPERTAGGQRRYSERDVARVQWLRERLEEGYRIGEAASLLGSVAAAPGRSAREHLKGLLDALDDLDSEAIGLRLDQAFALLPVEETFEVVLGPLLEAIGQRWRDGTTTTAEEHLVSEAVRSRLGHLLADAGGGGVHGVAVLACAPGERHELGLMMTTVALRRDGWKIVYLGADAPLADALALAEALSARVLGLSVTTEARTNALESGLRAGTPDGVSLVVGGSGATQPLARRLGAVHAGPALGGAVQTIRALAT
jgi:MerR family transcriptional regulator, light-induced transcriptional regulator